MARLNFSHGEFKEHAENIRNIRAAASKTRHMVSIFIDLPGVKMRIGRLQDGSLLLKNRGQSRSDDEECAWHADAYSC